MAHLVVHTEAVDKRDEWEKFMSTVTNWDTETYLDYLP